MRHVISILRALHIVVIIFVLFAWLVPDPMVLKVHLAFVPLMIVHWLSNKGTCFLTNIENWLLGASGRKNEQQGEFSRRLIETLCRVTPSDRALCLIIYSLVLASWSASLYRILSQALI